MNDLAHPMPPRVRAIRRPTVMRRRSLEGLTAFLLTVAALPAGLAVTVAFYVRDKVQRSQTIGFSPADWAGFGVTVAMAAAGAVLGWHARGRIRRLPDELHGITTSTVALYGGLALLTACVVVVTRLLMQ